MPAMPAETDETAGWKKMYLPVLPQYRAVHEEKTVPPVTAGRYECRRKYCQKRSDGQLCPFQEHFRHVDFSQPVFPSGSLFCRAAAIRSETDCQMSTYGRTSMSYESIVWFDMKPLSLISISPFPWLLNDMKIFDIRREFAGQWHTIDHVNGSGTW